MERDGQRVFGVSDGIPGRGWTESEGKRLSDAQLSPHAWLCVGEKTAQINVFFRKFKAILLYVGL